MCYRCASPVLTCWRPSKTCHAGLHTHTPSCPLPARNWGNRLFFYAEYVGDEPYEEAMKKYAAMPRVQEWEVGHQQAAGAGRCTAALLKSPATYHCALSAAGVPARLMSVSLYRRGAGVGAATAN